VQEVKCLIVDVSMVTPVGHIESDSREVTVQHATKNAEIKSVVDNA